MITKTIIVTKEVQVTIDETKFDAEFCRQFDESIFFVGDDLDEHMQNLAEKYVNGDAQGWDDDFLEGYGLLKDMGVKFEEIITDTEIKEG